MKAIILAGGGGTRLWPLSVPTLPKQFVQLAQNDNASLFQKTVLRLREPGLIDTLFVITNDSFYDLIDNQLEAIDHSLASHIICEPLQRNTAPAIVLAAKYLETVKQSSMDDVILILPSDHHITESEHLWQQLRLAENLAKDGKIVTFGVLPSRPETGYGYIKIDAPFQLDPDQANAQAGSLFFPVEEFTEKPDAPTAEAFLATGQYFWNAGMFAMTLRTLYHAISLYCPEIEQHMHLDYPHMLAEFARMPNISFDNAVMEHTDKAAVVPLCVDWSDVGSWDSIYDTFEKDGNQNAVVGEVLNLDTRNSLIMNKSDRLVATIGLEDIMIIDTPEALLVVKKGDSQKVKNLVETIKGLEKVTLPSTF